MVINLVDGILQLRNQGFMGFALGLVIVKV